MRPFCLLLTLSNGVAGGVAVGHWGVYRPFELVQHVATTSPEFTLDSL